jgi:DnaJ-class molecular chaperone
MAFLILFVVRVARESLIGVGTRPGGRPGEYRGQRGTQPRRTPSAYEVLQVQRAASQEEITSAYRRMVQQYHPDKVANLAPEFRELAERRMKEINAAYQRIKRS